MNKQQLASKIWESANRMRSKIEANDYKDYILGFIFYKYLSEKQLRALKAAGATADEIRDLREDDVELRGFVQERVGYFISYDNLFSTWIEKGADFQISDVRDALSAFNRLVSREHEHLFDGIFDTLETGLSKLGDTTASQTKAARDLIYLINEIPMDGKQDYDVLGFIYEYLISNFAANAGKKAGEFYTPHEVSVLMSEIIAHELAGREELEIYDPTSGSGSLLINIGAAVAKRTGDKNKIRYFAQELKQNTYNLTRMNLVMRDIEPYNIKTRNGDTLEDDWPDFDEEDPVGTYTPLYVDAVVSNPPYSQRWEPDGKESDPRYSRFGLAPRSKADYAFLLHDLYHLKPDGIMTIVLPHGVLFRGGEEGRIRQNLIEQNHVDAIIGLPANIFFGTGIPTIIMVLKQRRQHDDVLIIDASRGFEKRGKNNVLRASDIKRVADVVAAREDVPGFSRVVSREEIRANDYNLNIPRYLDSAEPTESWDVFGTMCGGVPERELAALAEFWEALPGLREALFKPVAPGYFEAVTTDAQQLGEVVQQHQSVAAFRAGFADAMAGFDSLLRGKLLDAGVWGQPAQAEDGLVADLFARLRRVPLVDEYAAYEALHQEWLQISLAFETLAQDGRDALRAVDPRMVLKKVRGKEVEVQDGWDGRVLPFEVVQRVLLAGELAKQRECEERVQQADSELSALVEELGEEVQLELGDAFDAEKGKFVAAAVAREVKTLGRGVKSADFAEGSAEFVLVRANELLSAGKAAKVAGKKLTDALQEHTREVIVSLSDADLDAVLEELWVQPILRAIGELPEAALRQLVKRVSELSEKYAVTLAQLDAEIAQVERELAGMLDDLTGSETDMRAIAELKKLLGGL